MPIQLPEEARATALKSVQSFFLHERGEEIGSVAADAVLEFMVEEIGPTMYNEGVRDAQERLQARLLDLDAELHEEEFPYWPRRGGR